MRDRALRVCVICVIVVSLGIAIRHFYLDDALIYARYVRNALAGRGLVFNTGEPTNALTSPLLAVILLAFSALLQGHILAAELMTSIAFLAGACILAEQLVPWSGMLIASTCYFYLCFGMETPLFLFLITLTVICYQKNRLDLIPLLALLTALTRFEGAMLGAVIAYDMYRRRTFPRLPSLVWPGLVVTGYLGFNFYFYRHLLPASASAKFAQGFSGYWGRWPRAFLTVGFSSPLRLAFHATSSIVALIAVFALIGICKQRWTLINRVLLPTLGGMLGFYVLFNIPNYHWYDAPFIFFGMLYAVIGLPKKPLAHPLLALVILYSSVTAFLTLSPIQGTLYYAQMGQWIEDHSAPQAKVAASEIGTLGWNCNRNIDDILGLTNPKNASHLVHHDLSAWLEEDKPDYVVVHDPAWYGETAATTSPLYTLEPVHFQGTYLMRRKTVEELHAASESRQ